ncbi:MAG TPA: polysaccharide biosynthesis/export family protein [Opitutaceae bacterium]|jgi:polysaccharide export outer membrane protein
MGAPSRLLGACICCFILATGLRAQSEHEAGAPDRSRQATSLSLFSALRSEYVLQPQDVIKIEVFQEPDMERQVRLSQECSVTLPLLGSVNLKGKTVQQATEYIRKLYDADYLVNPQINLIVLEYSKHDVSVLGQVDKAGAVDLPTDKPLYLLDAVANTGGFTRLADRKHVLLTRQEKDGTSSTTEINVDNIIESKGKADPWPLREGDVIFVPERIL